MYAIERNNSKRLTNKTGAQWSTLPKIQPLSAHAQNRFNHSFIKRTKWLEALHENSFHKENCIFSTNCPTIIIFSEKINSLIDFKIDHTIECQIIAKIILTLDLIPKDSKIAKRSQQKSGGIASSEPNHLKILHHTQRTKITSNKQMTDQFHTKITTYRRRFYRLGILS